MHGGQGRRIESRRPTEVNDRREIRRTKNKSVKARRDKRKGRCRSRVHRPWPRQRRSPGRVPRPSRGSRIGTLQPPPRPQPWKRRSGRPLGTAVGISGQNSCGRAPSSRRLSRTKCSRSSNSRSRQADGRGKQRIDACQHRLDRPEPEAKVLVDAGARRVVVPRRAGHVEVVANRVLEPRERAVVEEGRLQRHVAQRRAAELVAVVGIAGDLLQPEILVLARSVEDHVALAGRRIPGAICGTPTTCIAKSLNISFDEPPTAWQLDAAGLAEEEQGAALFGRRHRVRAGRARTCRSARRRAPA